VTVTSALRRREAFEALVRTAGPRRIEHDPVLFAHRYDDPADREIVAFLAAALAFGRVRSILDSVEDLLRRLGPSPRTVVASFRSVSRLDRRLDGFVHRWIGADEIRQALAALGALLRRHGSLEGAYPREGTPRERLAAFAARARAAVPGTLRRGTAHLFASPTGGSACKRISLFLRWVARPADGVDLGLWTTLAPRDLVVPLDTHVARIARRIGLTNRKTANWAMAEETTASLARIDPNDPTRYDFALAHLGIGGGCPEKLSTADCRACVLRDTCRTGRRRTRSD
jgi:uncharacterized protein (TIGR02757 family)